MPLQTRRTTLALIGPGILVAATGVGAGDLATAGFAGAELGLGVAWAVIVGAALKLVLTENLARHQLASKRTVLESAIAKIGLAFYIPFGLYLVAWSYFVGAALISANAVTLAALLEPPNPGEARPILGAAASIAGLALALIGGFKLFERVMAACIAVMVLVVLAAAVLSKPDIGALTAGLVIPRIPASSGQGLGWTLALIGGVGGTLTILCYSYWMREAGRTDPSEIRTARLDITIGYTVTALFGVAMLVIAAPLDVKGRGSQLIVDLADRLADAFADAYNQTLGQAMRLAFLVGCFGAVFSSLLGVWQAVPYIFADWWRSRSRIGKPDAPPPPLPKRSAPYTLFAVAIATVPLLSLRFDFAAVQRVYAIVGAAFVPALAIVLLVINNTPSLVGVGFRNRVLANATLILTLALTAAIALFDQLA